MASVSTPVNRDDAKDTSTDSSPSSLATLRRKVTDATQVNVDRLLLKLATTLQSSLSAEEIVRLFSHELGNTVPHDNVWLVRDGDEEVTLTRRTHHCRYDLALMGTSLGELIISRRRPFTAVEIDIIESVLGSLIYPLRNAYLYEQAVNSAMKDPLTGVNNRSALSSYLGQKVSEYHRHGSRTSLIMLDVDHFKSVNDNYGHLAGDTVLRAVADCVTGCTRTSDAVFRYGGEEFLIVLSNTSLVGARLLAERVRSSIETMQLAVSEHTINVTVSLGVAEIQRDESADMFLGRADRQLYNAKRAGRNCVCAAPNSPPAA
ncbi:MAG: GGDEF domain-containing protein [Gammaproteobacteria bacterium]|nr:GGDEF domain-containing protein [Gammaproteobacteria bacterium]